MHFHHCIDISHDLLKQTSNENHLNEIGLLENKMIAQTYLKNIKSWKVIMLKLFDTFWRHCGPHVLTHLQPLRAYLFSQRARKSTARYEQAALRGKRRLPVTQTEIDKLRFLYHACCSHAILQLVEEIQDDISDSAFNSNSSLHYNYWHMDHFKSFQTS